MKTRPHVKVHNGIRNHPRYAAVFADPKTRGIVVGLWSVAADRFAARTEDRVTLTAGDLTWITGAKSVGPALQSLRSVCARMGYELETQGGERRTERRAAGEVAGEVPDRWPGRCRRGDGGGDGHAAGPLVVVVTIRNFARKQGFPGGNQSPKGDDKSPQSTPPEYRVPNTDTDTRESPPQTPPRSQGENRKATGSGKAPPTGGAVTTAGRISDVVLQTAKALGYDPSAAIAANGGALRSPLAQAVLAGWLELAKRHGLRDGTPDPEADPNYHRAFCRALMEHRNPDDWGRCFEAIERQPSMLGSGKDGWKVSLQWLVAREENFHRTIHGRWRAA